MTRRTIPLLLGALACAAATSSTVAVADEVRLTDGRVLVGPTNVRGQTLHVGTKDGWVQVDLADVQRVRTDHELRKELESLAEHGSESAFRQLELARIARQWGLEPEMWDYLDACVESTSENERMRERLDDFLAQLEPELLPLHVRQRPPEARVRSLLYKVRPSRSPAQQAAIEAILAAMEEASPPIRQRARQAGSGQQRLCALRAISRRPEDGNDRFLYRTAILDSSAEIRAEAMGMTARDGRARDAIAYLAPGLLHGTPLVRMRTADAFANLNDSGAVEVLVAAGPLAASLPGGSTRGHVAFIEQESYIRDFDVEVAQAAFIADPKVSVVQSGTVLDATVHAVISERVQVVGAYRRALRHLTAADPGPDTSTWAAWLAELDQSSASASAATTPGAMPCPTVNSGYLGAPAGLTARPVGPPKGPLSARGPSSAIGPSPNLAGAQPRIASPAGRLIPPQGQVKGPAPRPAAARPPAPRPAAARPPAPRPAPGIRR